MNPPTSDLLSDIARNGPPMFFRAPSVPVTFLFDQGLAAEETFPLDEFARLSQQVLAEDGGRALEYTSFAPNEHTRPPNSCRATARTRVSSDTRACVSRSRRGSRPRTAVLTWGPTTSSFARDPSTPSRWASTPSSTTAMA